MWPMMTVTVTNFEGFTRQQFCKNVVIFVHLLQELLPSESLKVPFEMENFCFTQALLIRSKTPYNY